MKNLKFNYFVDIATQLFMSSSIAEVTIKDIAMEAEVGEATLYRYFGKKQTIVLMVAMKLQEQTNQEYFNLKEEKTGFDKLKAFYESYFRIFSDHPNYYNFIRDFDAYMANEGKEELVEYENGIDVYKNIFLEAYELGLKDGTVRQIEDIEMFYFSTAHSLLELCKKLSMNNGLLTQDRTIEKTKEIECLVHIFLNSLKPLCV
ncbi:MAG: TetR/AcrR family transcriptional regulator [Bacilli bacterium]|nr:TetR/AcrR family transcriptional regulator [Bacilli bacterium]